MGNTANYRQVTVEESWSKHAKAFGADDNNVAATNGAAMCCVYDQSQGENQGVIVVTQRYLINYNPLTGSRRLRIRLEGTVTCATYIKNPLYTFKRKNNNSMADQKLSNGLIVIGTSNGLIQIRRSGDFSIVRNIRTRKQLELQFTKRSIGKNSSSSRRNSGNFGGFNSSNSGRGIGGRARSASNSLNNANRIRISFDDEEDLESLSESPTTISTRKRNRSDPPRMGNNNNNNNNNQNDKYSDNDSNVNNNNLNINQKRKSDQTVPATALLCCRTKSGDQVIVGDLKGTTRIFNLSKGPEIISLYRHVRVTDNVSNNKNNNNDDDDKNNNDHMFYDDTNDSFNINDEINSSPTSKHNSDDFGNMDTSTSSSIVDRVASVSSLAYWERQYSCIFVGYADGLVGQFNVTVGTWMRGMKSPSPFNTYSIGDDANTTGNTTSQKNSMKISSKTKVEKGKSKASRAIKMLRVLPQYKILLGTTFADKYLMMWDLETYTSTAIDMTANLPRNSGTFNNSSMATSTFVEPGGKFLFVGFDDGGFTVNSLHFDTGTRELTLIPIRIFATVAQRFKPKDSDKLPSWLKKQVNKVQLLNTIHFDRFTDTLLTGDVCGVARMVHHASGEMAVENLKEIQNSKKSKFESRTRSMSNISSDSGGGGGGGLGDGWSSTSEGGNTPKLTANQNDSDEEIEIDLEI